MIQIYSYFFCVQIENDENRSLQKRKRNKTKEELGKEDVRATRTAGGMDRKTRSRTSAN